MFEAVDRARTAHYKLTSTVILSLGTDSENLGTMDLSGNMVRQVEQDMAVEDDGSHVANIGKVRCLLKPSMQSFCIINSIAFL